MNALQSWGLALALLGIAILAGSPSLFSAEAGCAETFCGASLDADIIPLLQVVTWSAMALVIIGGSAIIWGGSLPSRESATATIADG